MCDQKGKFLFNAFIMNNKVFFSSLFSSFFSLYCQRYWPESVKINGGYRRSKFERFRLQGRRNDTFFSSSFFKNGPKRLTVLLRPAERSRHLIPVEHR